MPRGGDALRESAAKAIGGSDITCSDLKAELADAGAPNSVYRDFRAGNLCVKGE